MPLGERIMAVLLARLPAKFKETTGRICDAEDLFQSAVEDLVQLVDMWTQDDPEAMGPVEAFLTRRMRSRARNERHHDAELGEVVPYRDTDAAVPPSQEQHVLLREVRDQLDTVKFEGTALQRHRERVKLKGALALS